MRARERSKNQRPGAGLERTQTEKQQRHTAHFKNHVKMIFIEHF